MNSNFKYKDELNKLLENEDNFDFFLNIAKKNVRSSPETFKKVFDIVFEFSKENKLIIPMAWSYYYFGWYYADLSRYEEAIEFFLLSHDMFESIGFKKGIIYACNGLTNIYCQSGQFRFSSEWGLKGISLAEENDEKEERIILLINSAITYIQMKDFNKSKDVLNCIKLINNELTKRQWVAYKLCLAEVEINIGDPEIALIHLDEVTKTDDELTIDVSDTYKLKGMAYVKMHKYKLAKKEFEKSIDFSDFFGYAFEKCCTMIEWAKFSCLIKRQYEAIDILIDVVNVSKTRKFRALLKESCRLLHKIHKELGNYEESLKYLEDAILIDEQMYDYEQNRLMAKMNINHAKREADLYKLLYDKTELLSSIGQKIISNLDVNSVIDIISKEIYKLIDTVIFGIAVYDSEKREGVYYFINSKLKIKYNRTFNIDDNLTFSAYCIKNKKDIIINNVEKEFNNYPSLNWDNYIRDSSERSMIYTPLMIEEKVVGVMTVQSQAENAYDKNDLNTLKIIANYSAIAIDNAISYKKIEDIATYDNMTGFLTRFEIIRLGEIIYEKHKDIKRLLRDWSSLCFVPLDIHVICFYAFNSVQIILESLDFIFAPNYVKDDEPFC